MKYCRHDPLGVHGSDGVGRYLPRQLAPIAAGDVHDDGAVAGQLLGAEQFHNLVGGAVMDAVLDGFSVLHQNYAHGPISMSMIEFERTC